MPHLPEFPVNVPQDQRQEDGKQDNEERSLTHIGGKVNGTPPATTQPRGPIRYYEDES